MHPNWDYLLSSHFEKPIIWCNENPLDEGYPVKPAREVHIASRNPKGEIYKNSVMTFRPETFQEDCYTAAKNIILNRAYYSKRIGLIIIDEPGKKDELKRPFHNKKYVPMEQDDSTWMIEEAKRYIGKIL